MIDLDLRLPATSSFSAPAAEELRSVLNVYASSITAECSRLAAAEALDGRPHEITAAIVKKANTVFQLTNGITLSKRAPGWLRVSSALLPIVTGVFPNLVDMRMGLNIFLTVALLVLSTISVAALVIKDHFK